MAWCKACGEWMPDEEWEEGFRTCVDCETDWDPWGDEVWDDNEEDRDA